MAEHPTPEEEFSGSTSLSDSNSESESETESDFSESESEDEGQEDYKRGGYYPVTIGSMFNRRYKVISKLGWGNFSTVWEVADIDDLEKRYALKIVKSASNYAEAAEDEIEMMKALTEKDPDHKSYCAHLVDNFKSSGPNGSHICMVFEKMGSNLLSLIKLYRYKGIPIPLVKIITKQVLIALDYMNSCELIHTDLKPENVLLFQKINRLYDSPFEVEIPEWKPKPQMQKIYLNQPQQRRAAQSKFHRGAKAKTVKPQKVPSQTKGFIEVPLEIVQTEPKRRRGLTVADCKINLVDFGNATWMKKHFTDDVQTRQYRAPEIILGRTWNEKIDIWSLACMVFELITGDFLFKPKSSSHYTKEEDHVARFVELLGPFPKSYLRECKFASDYFNRSGQLRAFRQDELRPCTLHETLVKYYHYSVDGAKEITDFLLPMLEYESEKRASAKEMLQHKWLADVTFPWDECTAAQAVSSEAQHQNE